MDGFQWITDFLQYIDLGSRNYIQGSTLSETRGANIQQKLAGVHLKAFIYVNLKALSCQLNRIERRLLLIEGGMEEFKMLQLMYISSGFRLEQFVNLRMQKNY